MKFSQLPVEVLLDSFKALTRLDLDDCQRVNRKWNHLILSNEAILPGYHFNSFSAVSFWLFFIIIRLKLMDFEIFSTNPSVYLMRMKRRKMKKAQMRIWRVQRGRRRMRWTRMSQLEPLKKKEWIWEKGMTRRKLRNL